MSLVRMTKDGQIAIPAAVREKIAAPASGLFDVVAEDGKIVLNPQTTEAAVAEDQRAEARAALQRIRARAEARKLGAFDWREWKSYRDEGRP